MTDTSNIKVADAFKHLDPRHDLVDDIVPGGFSLLRFKGKSWTLQHEGKQYPLRRGDDGTPLSYIDIVVVGISKYTPRAYFSDEWNEDSNNAPVCTSAKGDVPDASSSIPQSKSCGTCKHDEWGSKPGSKAKACQEHKRIAALLLPSMTQQVLAKPLLEPVFLKIPPGSMRPMKTYFDGLMHKGIPFESVITRVAFSPERTFEMSFRLLQALTNAEAPIVLPLRDSSLTKQIIGASAGLREIAPPADKPPERVETGLLSAFGNGGAAEAPKPQPSRGGRPAGSKNKPKLVEAAEPKQDPNAPDAADESWEDSDTDLDDAVAKLKLGNKTQTMLK